MTHSPAATRERAPDPAFAARLFDLVQAPLRWQLIEIGLTLDLFDRLPTARTAADMARELDLDPRRLALVLDGLSALGALGKQDGHYALTAEGAAYLSSAGPLSLRPMLLNLASRRHAALADLLTEPPPPPLDMSDPAFWTRAAANLRAFHRAMALPVMLEALEGLASWPRARRVLDLGAGSDVLARAIVARSPEKTVTILDLPPLAAALAEGVAADGLEDRIIVRAGDYNTADLGQGHDVAWASMTLYYAHDLEALCARVGAALAPGGVFVSFHEGLTDERTQPELHVVGRLTTALRGPNLSFDHGRIASALRRAGFARVDSHPVATPFGLMHLDVGWKTPPAGP
ncbi:class I SAM-dependent methyltransferase [Pararhodospirillum oryzae]|uniref:O-methyltransferase n=1 Tax=Pararhodospirillum oryzae TaxID=478448 RepID=A0A512HB73_9PROT|nr:class I SAM-dependent methyltransferase [Pararhodospirillum oryzae]GEO82707.1 O-methyltransferase [Pararhodospirillum oryzae]